MSIELIQKNDYSNHFSWTQFFLNPNSTSSRLWKCVICFCLINNIICRRYKNSLIIIKSWRIADYNKNYKDPLYLPHVYQRSNFIFNHLEKKLLNMKNCYFYYKYKHTTCIWTIFMKEIFLRIEIKLNKWFTLL